MDSVKSYVVGSRRSYWVITSLDVWTQKKYNTTYIFYKRVYRAATIVCLLPICCMWYAFWMRVSVFSSAYIILWFMVWERNINVAKRASFDPKTTRQLIKHHIKQVIKIMEKNIFDSNWSPRSFGASCPNRNIKRTYCVCIFYYFFRFRSENELRYWKARE